MSAKTNHFRIGVFVLAGVGLMFAALFAFGAFSRFELKTNFETYVAGDVEGLSVGSPVKLRGVLVGAVTAIKFTRTQYDDKDGHYILVEFQMKDRLIPLSPGGHAAAELEQEIQLGLRARVKSQGITGTSFVSLEYLDPKLSPPVAVSWTPRHHYIPSAESQFGQILTSIEKTLRNLEKIDLGQTLQRVESLLNDTSLVVSNLHKVNFEKLAGGADTLIADTRVTNQRLQELLATTQQTLTNLNLAGVSRHTGQFLADASTTNAKLQQLLDHLDELGAGPLRDSLVQARQTIAEAGEVLRDLKQYPSGFLLGQPPPPARSVTRTGK